MKIMESVCAFDNCFSSFVMGVTNQLKALVGAVSSVPEAVGKTAGC